jgi:hypothetical protein
MNPATPAVTPTDSAPVLDTPESLTEALETGFLPEDPHYRLTGEFKEPGQPKKDEVPPTEKAGDSATPEGDTAAAPPAAEPQEKDKPQQKTQATSESRWAKITRENKELRETVARLQSAPPKEVQRETQQAPPPATETKLAEPKETDKNPDGSWKYKSLGEYQAAVREYDRKSLLAEVQAQNERTQREQQLQQAERSIADNLNQKFSTARTKYADFDHVALNNDLVIPKGSAADVFLIDSPHGADVLYYLGQHPEITQGFYANYDPQTGKFVNKTNQLHQIRKLMEIEAEVSGKKASPAPPVTTAPRPPHQVSGKGTVQKDAVEQAVEDGDSEAYIAAQNARELAKRRKK